MKHEGGGPPRYGAPNGANPSMFRTDPMGPNRNLLNNNNNNGPPSIMLPSQLMTNPQMSSGGVLMPPPASLIRQSSSGAGGNRISGENMQGMPSAHMLGMPGAPGMLGGPGMPGNSMQGIPGGPRTSGIPGGPMVGLGMPAGSSHSFSGGSMQGLLRTSIPGGGPMQGMPRVGMPGAMQGMPRGGMPGMPGGPMQGMPGGPMQGMPGGPMQGMPGGPMQGMPGGPMQGMPGGPMQSISGNPMHPMPGMAGGVLQGISPNGGIPPMPRVMQRMPMTSNNAGGGMMMPNMHTNGAQRMGGLPPGAPGGMPGAPLGLSEGGSSRQGSMLQGMMHCNIPNGLGHPALNSSGSSFFPGQMGDAPGQFSSQRSNRPPPPPAYPTPPQFTMPFQHQMRPPMMGSFLPVGPGAYNMARQQMAAFQQMGAPQGYWEPMSKQSLTLQLPSNVTLPDYIPIPPPFKRKRYVMETMSNVKFNLYRNMFKKSSDTYIFDPESKYLLACGSRRIYTKDVNFVCALGEPEACERLLSVGDSISQCEDNFQWMKKKLRCRQDAEWTSKVINIVGRIDMPDSMHFIDLHDFYCFITTVFPHWRIVYDPEIAPVVALCRVNSKFDCSADDLQSYVSMSSDVKSFEKQTSMDTPNDDQPANPVLNIKLEPSVGGEEPPAARSSVSIEACFTDPAAVIDDDADNAPRTPIQLTADWMLQVEFNAVTEARVAAFPDSSPKCLQRLPKFYESSILYEKIPSWLKVNILVTMKSIVLHNAPDEDVLTQAWIYIFPLLRYFLTRWVDQTKMELADLQMFLPNYPPEMPMEANNPYKIDVSKRLVSHGKYPETLVHNDFVNGGI